MVGDEYGQGQGAAEWAYLIAMLYIGTLVVFVLGYGAVRYYTDCPTPTVKEVVRYVERDTSQVVEPPPAIRIPVVTTGYCPGWPCVSKKWADGLTATGKSVRVGHCAADWTHFPPGTKFIVPGYGPCVVEDSGNKVRGRHLDLYFHTADEARQWGRQTTTVTLVRWGREGGS